MGARNWLSEKPVVVLADTRGLYDSLDDMPHRYWTVEELHADLQRLREELVAAGKGSNTVQTYTDRAERYVRWLEGKYDPRAR